MKPESSFLLKIRDVAYHLQQSESTVRTLIREGKLPVYRDGKSIRVRRATLERYIKEHEEDPVAAVAVPYLPPQRHR